jgi:tetratricopeptide (TPR) repeat protein
VGDRVRISADLVQASTDKHLWSDTYERDAKDVFALQTEVARVIAQQVQVRLTPQEQAGFAAAITSARQINSGAQEAYLQGRFYWNKRTPDALKRALEFFERAEALEPGFALAFAGEADAYNLLAGTLEPTSVYPRAKAAARRALSIDPTLAEADTSLAFATFVFDRNWQEAEDGFKRALQHNPGYATAHHWYGIFLSARGRFSESEAEFVKAKALDPLSASIRTSFGNMLYMSRRYDEAIAELRSSLEIDPGAPATYFNLAYAYHQKGLLDQATSEAQRGLQVTNHRMLVAELARLAAQAGRRADALAAAKQVEAAGLPSNEIATIYSALGDNDRAFDYLERAAREHATGLLWAKVDPALDSLRDDPRFADLLRTLGL